MMRPKETIDQANYKYNKMILGAVVAFMIYDNKVK
jgi:hypothetical protein